MSTAFTVSRNEVISLIEEHYSKKTGSGRPVRFDEKAISALIEMQEATATLFNYTWCEDYVDSLIQSLRGCMFLDYVDREEQSEELDRMRLPETVTINRDDANSLFYLIQLVIKYLGDMNHLNKLFEAVTTNQKN